MPETCAAHALDPPAGRSSACREWDPVAKQPGWAVAGPLCDTEIRVAQRDTRMLLWDLLDLEQMIPRPYGQSLDGQPSGRPGPPMPVSAGPDALQREIVHVLTVWEEVLRDRCGLSEPPARVNDSTWYTTVSRRPDPARVRAGWAAQRALSVVEPRLAELARVPATAVLPAGVEDDWAEVAGWEAVLHLSRLHARARAMLGRTRRTERLPGDCSGCGAADLRRDEPRYEGDPCDVYCGGCARQWSRDEYDRYVMLLVWPGMVAA